MATQARSAAEVQLDNLRQRKQLVAEVQSGIIPLRASASRLPQHRRFDILFAHLESALAVASMMLVELAQAIAEQEQLVLTERQNRQQESRVVEDAAPPDAAPPSRPN